MQISLKKESLIKAVIAAVAIIILVALGAWLDRMSSRISALESRPDVKEEMDAARKDIVNTADFINKVILPRLDKLEK